MNRHYTNYLFKKYEPLYDGRKLGPQRNLMCFGFECGDGWFNILRSLSGALCRDWIDAKESYNNIKDLVGQRRFSVTNNPSVNEDKYNPVITQEMVATALDKVKVEEAKVPKAVQVKEKFGTLRFYTGSTTSEQDAYISFAVRMSAVTCDVCGAPGKMDYSGWVRCRCKAHKS